MAESQPWVFKQLGGERKTLKLEGYAAPFGRPRRSPVVVEEYGQKIQTVHYPGQNSTPTRHFLGTKYEPFELQGRWMTKFMTQRVLEGTATANDYADQWVQFIQDGQRVSVSWGNIVSYVGIVEKIRLARESANEIAWKMTILVDDRPSLVSSSPPTDDPSLAGVVDKLDGAVQEFLAGQSVLFEKSIPDWEPDLFDSIDGLISAVNSYANIFLQIANQFDNLTSAFTSELFRLQSSARALRTALSELNDTIESTNTDLILFTRTAETDVNWISGRADMLLAQNEIRTFLAEAERQIEIALRGKTTTSYTAIDGDTWEAIASLVYEDPNRAGEIRSANFIKSGELPLSGKTYSIPS